MIGSVLRSKRSHNAFFFMQTIRCNNPHKELTFCLFPNPSPLGNNSSRQRVHSSIHHSRKLIHLCYRFFLLTRLIPSVVTSQLVPCFPPRFLSMIYQCPRINISPPITAPAPAQGSLPHTRGMFSLPLTVPGIIGCLFYFPPIIFNLNIKLLICN